MSGGCGDYQVAGTSVSFYAGDCGPTIRVHTSAPARKVLGPKETLSAWAACQAELAEDGFIRGTNPSMTMNDMVKLADIMAAKMVEEHRQVLEKQGKLAVAAYVAAIEENQEIMENMAEAQRQLAADLNVGVNEIVLSAIMAAEPMDMQDLTKPPAATGGNRDADTTSADTTSSEEEEGAAAIPEPPRRSRRLNSVQTEVEAAAAAAPAAEAQAASPSCSNSAHEDEVQQLCQPSAKRPRTRGAAAAEPGQEDGVAATPPSEEPLTMRQAIEVLQRPAALTSTPAPSSASALEAEVLELRLQLQRRDALVDQLRGDVAALKSVKQESCTPLIQYMQGQVGVAPMDTAGASGAGV